MLLGFQWLRSQTSAAIASTPARRLTDQQTQILQLCEKPITLGELSDHLGVGYRELALVMAELVADQEVNPVYLPVGTLNCLHYIRRGYEPPSA